MFEKASQQCGAFFVEKFMKEKKIYCPRCGRKVATYDGRSKIDIVVKCRKCNKKIVYRVATGDIEVKPLPARQTASGMTFI